VVVASQPFHAAIKPTVASLLQGWRDATDATGSCSPGGSTGGEWESGVLDSCGTGSPCGGGGSIPAPSLALSVVTAIRTSRDSLKALSPGSGGTPTL
jgi:hypothetical protein